MPDYALMNQCLYEGKAKEVEQMTKDALADGRHFQEVLNEGLIAGMSVVGEDFKHNILYVPEVLIAARAMKAGMAVLKPLLSARENASERAAVLLMGTVRGDLHDIGKNLVCMMAEGAGFEVHDIGVDQSVEKFLAAAERVNATIVGMSALLTTTMTYMKTVIDGFEAAGKGHIKMAIGGAPISQMFADEIGADGYGQNASAAVDLFLRLAGAARAGAGAAAGAGAREAAVELGAAGAPVAASEALALVADAARSSSAAPGRVATAAPAGKRSTFKVLYWQEIPSQVKVEDDVGDELTVELSPRFARRIDAAAQARGLTSAEDYLAQWHWSDEEERTGPAHAVAAAVKAELEGR
jgi:5-methyltetrahydrofolate--homocysteine methyltransferase